MLAGVASALLFAGSYTFWSQSIIAEVYALHILFVSLSMWLLLRWDARPTHLHLVAFFGAYALGFGNHLSMILLAPGYALFLLVSASGGWRFVLARRVWVSGCACALAGGLIYSSSLHSLWLEPLSPIRLSDALRTFWFDLTKADWRATLAVWSASNAHARPPLDVRIRSSSTVRLGGHCRRSAWASCVQFRPGGNVPR